MNDLMIPNEAQLPAKVDDLAKFVLIGQERLVALKAEIRAINKVKLASDVYDQKREEARQLSDLIIVAAQRLGEFTTQMPKASGVRTDLQPSSDGATRLSPQTKAQALGAMGLSKDQVSRFETMARHPEEVAQARAEAAAENRPVTQTGVLDLIKYKEEKSKAEYRQIDEDARLAQLMNKAVGAVVQLPTDKESIEAMRRGSALVADGMLDSVKRATQTLQAIRFHFERRGR